MYSIDQFESLIALFETYLKTINKLCLHVHDELKAMPIWVDDGHQQFVSDRDKLIYVLKHISPKEGLTPQETFNCPGVVSATTKTIKLIERVNAVKDDFKAEVQCYKHLFKANPTKPVRQILASAGFGGVKLLQVYRHIPYITLHPRRIAWTKSVNSCRTVISHTKAKEKLTKIGQGEHIDIQLSKLSLLKTKDKLAIYREVGHFWGVNIATFKDENGKSTNYRLRQVSLPVFYLHNKNKPLPEVCFGNKSNRKNTGTRIDKIIEDKPFLKSIRAYRYKI
jgi:hypothetical protein